MSDSSVTVETAAYRRYVMGATLLGAALRIVMLASKWNTAMSQASQPTTPLNVIAG